MAPWQLRLLYTSLLLGLCMCQAEQPVPASDAASEPAPSDLPQAAEVSPRPGSSITSRAPLVPALAGIEELAPLRWTSWPLENVAFERYAGWRIDATHGGFEREPGLVLGCRAGDFVLAIADATVAEVARNADDQLELTLDHGEGIRSHYGPLSDVHVHAGLAVPRGAAIGLSAGTSLRLRVLVSELDVDPLLVLRQPLHGF